MCRAHGQARIRVTLTSSPYHSTCRGAGFPGSILRHGIPRPKAHLCEMMCWQVLVVPSPLVFFFTSMAHNTIVGNLHVTSFQFAYGGRLGTSCETGLIRPLFETSGSCVPAFVQPKLSATTPVTADEWNGLWVWQAAKPQSATDRVTHSSVVMLCLCEDLSFRKHHGIPSS
jgi:hypothetical protein